MGGSLDGHVFFRGDRFWAMAGNKAYTSKDGRNWGSTGFGGKVSALAVSEDGVWAATDGNNYYRSTNGSNWNKVNGPKGMKLTAMEWGRSRRRTSVRRTTDCRYGSRVTGCGVPGRVF